MKSIAVQTSARSDRDQLSSVNPPYVLVLSNHCSHTLSADQSSIPFPKSSMIQPSCCLPTSHCLGVIRVSAATVSPSTPFVRRNRPFIRWPACLTQRATRPRVCAHARRANIMPTITNSYPTITLAHHHPPPPVCLVPPRPAQFRPEYEGEGASLRAFLFINREFYIFEAPTIYLTEKYTFTGRIKSADKPRTFVIKCLA